MASGCQKLIPTVICQGLSAFTPIRRGYVMQFHPAS